jgi:hypothetical protein
LFASPKKGGKNSVNHPYQDTRADVWLMRYLHADVGARMHDVDALHRVRRAPHPHYYPWSLPALRLQNDGQEAIEEITLYNLAICIICVEPCRRPRALLMPHE